ncbi:MAG: electron transfer flavoprotein-ubiquinone oxidoreductase [Dysgonamonadaceae bacterium]|jgi:electron-transferring-flavoprotein dehydrogenase|nr:electron transfer flavoprotein-ubiquinone oxidoreductase [Dysgonamonadaceae bacterium]
MNNTNTVLTDVLIVGAGPSGLATAIHLADLLKKNDLERRILVIEKGASIGSHILSGAVIRPAILEELLPEIALAAFPLDASVSKDTLWLFNSSGGVKSPMHPPGMSNKGNYIVSLGQLCRFLAIKAEEKGVEIYPGFAVSEVLYNDQGKIRGAKTIDTGVDHHGKPLENFQPGTCIEAQLTIFAEGTRGSLTKTVIRKFDLQKGKNPQVYSLGCKELWSVPEGAIAPGEVYHTMGYPLNLHEFGGGFIYGLNNNRVAVGLVAGLDYADPIFDVHAAFQIWKTHPKIANLLKGGKLLEFGAKTLPEGGYYSLPQCYTDNALIVGDSAGFLVMPALKGIHLAIRSGLLAAETAIEAFSEEDFSEKTLQRYETKIRNSSIYQEMYPVRNFRQAFAKGMMTGGWMYGTQLLTGGAGFVGKVKVHTDANATQTVTEFSGKSFKKRFSQKTDFDKRLTFDKATDVFYSGAHHDEQQVCHLRVNNPVSYEEVNINQYDAPCRYFCPAEVYEIHTGRDGRKELRIHSENCMHCKTCDIKEPGDGITWMVPNGGNGPDYQNM